MTAPLRQHLEGKRFGLVLSAGFFGFYGHAGFVKSLLGAGLKPSAWAGTSAGGLIASYAAAGVEPARIEELVLAQRRESFWDPDPIGAALDMARRGHGASGLLKGDRFRALLERTLPVRRFEDAQPLVLVAANLTKNAPEVFARGELAPAVHATCAYPGLFRAVKIDGALYWDGGLVDKAPALALADSAAGKSLDAILVHYLPSRAGAPLGGTFAYLQGMASGMAALRRDHFRLQLELLKARGVKVFVIVSTLPAVSPTTMEKGVEALRAAEDAAAAALNAPPAEFTAGD